MRLLLPTLFTFFAFSGFTQSLFNNAVVHKVEIEFFDDNWDHLLDSLASDGFGTGSGTGRILAHLTINDTPFDSCGVRYKGNSSMDTTSNKNRECVGQGVANVATGFIGGMAGCAMIGQSVINVKSGGRGRLSTLVAGLLLLIMVVFLGDWVSQIPMAALVAVMIMVSIGTFNWDSIRNLREHPKSSSVVMIATVIVTVATHDLARGVLTGVLLSGFFFAHKVGRIMRVESRACEDGRARTYTIYGQVFFASADRFVQVFDFQEVIDKVYIDVSKAHFWDITAVSALDKVIIKFRREGTEIEVIGLNEASATMVDRFAVHDKDDVDDLLLNH